MTEPIPELNPLEDRWLLGEIDLDNGTLLVRLNQTAQHLMAHPQLGIELKFAIPFNSPPQQGVPNPAENEILAELEDTIRNAVDAATTGVHVLTLTAPEVRELVFYIAEGADIGALHQSLQAQSDTHDLQCMAVRDADWATYRSFLPPSNDG